MIKYGGFRWMTKNIQDFELYFFKHFSKSKKSILKFGISNGDQVSYYSWNNDLEKKHFGLGSISKTIISTYVCEMIQNNELDINQTIDYYLPLTKKRKYPTVLQCLTHTSGYHAYIPFIKSIWIMLTNGFNNKNIYKNIDQSWLLNSVNKKKPFRHRKYRYTDYNYAIIAMIIEKLKKRSYKDVITEYLRNEIGMTETYYGSEDTTQNDIASWVWNENNPFLAAGGLFSTTEDMIKFLRYQINNKEKLYPSFIKYHEISSSKHTFTGFSWSAFYNSEFYWHIGGQGYYRSYALFDLKKNITIIILSTIDVNIQRVSRLGSSLYRNLKRNNQLINEYLNQLEVKS